MRLIQHIYLKMTCTGQKKKKRANKLRLSKLTCVEITTRENFANKYGCFILFFLTKKTDGASVRFQKYSAHRRVIGISK